MTITITINCDNASFEDAGISTEAGRILRKLAKDLEGGVLGEHENLFDYNGNRVGQMEVA